MTKDAQRDMLSTEQEKPTRKGSGIMSEPQWQVWMNRVSDRMRQMNEAREARKA